MSQYPGCRNSYLSTQTLLFCVIEIESLSTEIMQLGMCEMPEYPSCRLSTSCPLPRHLADIVEIYVLVSHQARPRDHQYSRGLPTILLCRHQLYTFPDGYPPSERAGMHAEYRVFRYV